MPPVVVFSFQPFCLFAADRFAAGNHAGHVGERYLLEEQSQQECGSDERHRYQSTGASESAYAVTMPSRTGSGRALAWGSKVAVAFPASAADGAGIGKTAVSFPERLLVKIVPKIATPSAAPTSRK